MYPKYEGNQGFSINNSPRTSPYMTSQGYDNRLYQNQMQQQEQQNMNRFYGDSYYQQDQSYLKNQSGFNNSHYYTDASYNDQYLYSYDDYDYQVPSTLKDEKRMSKELANYCINPIKATGSEEIIKKPKVEEEKKQLLLSGKKLASKGKGYDMYGMNNFNSRIKETQQVDGLLKPGFAMKSDN